MCPSKQLFYWPHQRSWVRVFLEITEGEMSLEFFRVLHQRELGTGTWHYTGEGALHPLNHLPATPKSILKHCHLQIPPNFALPNPSASPGQKSAIRSLSSVVELSQT